MDSFSAFPYENFLGIIKSHSRSTHRPLQQLINRDKESHGILIKSRHYNCLNYLKLKKPFAGHHVEIEGQQYTTVVTKDFTLRIKEADRYFITTTGEIVRFYSVIKSSENIIIAGKKFKYLENYYNFPVEFSKLGIFKVSELEEELIFGKLRMLQTNVLPCLLLTIPTSVFLSFSISTKVWIPFFYDVYI